MIMNTENDEALKKEVDDLCDEAEELVMYWLHADFQQTPRQRWKTQQSFAWTMLWSAYADEKPVTFEERDRIKGLKQSLFVGMMMVHGDFEGNESRNYYTRQWLERIHAPWAR